MVASDNVECNGAEYHGADCANASADGNVAEWPNADDLLQRVTTEFKKKMGDWLERTHAESQAALRAAEPNGRSNEIGLVDLVREFTALRHEVKLQTKSARGLDEQVAAALALFQSAISSLSNERRALEDAGRQFRAVEPKEADAAQRAALPLLEALVDLDEAIARGAAAAETAHGRLRSELDGAISRQLADSYAALPGWKRWLCRHFYAEVDAICRAREEDRLRSFNYCRKTIDALVGGYAMVRKRLERSMAKEGLSRVATVGLPVDPHTMTVVEVVEPDAADGCSPGFVAEEIRPGYRWNGRMIRFAEVRAVREGLSEELSVLSSQLPENRQPTTDNREPRTDNRQLTTDN